MIDTHTHLYFPEYGDDVITIVDNCKNIGVTHLVLPNVDLESISYMKEFHQKYPDLTSMAIGLHPTEVKENWEEIMETVKTELSTGEYVAIGEVGMDLYWDKTYLGIQKKAFEYQLELAQDFEIPVIIHSRDALEETLECIDNVKPTTDLIFHSFTGTKDDVKRIRETCNPYFGINGVVTYKNAAGLREALPEIGLERMILETDSPYLTPVPYRGKPNNSSYISLVRDKIAEVMGLGKELVETTTDKNARSIFGI